MYWEDLSEEQQNKIWEDLRHDPEICDPEDSTEIQNENIDDYINCNNNKYTIMQMLEDTYE